MGQAPTPKWDGKNLIVTGGSQGGALTIATGLDPRVTAAYYDVVDFARRVSRRLSSRGVPFESFDEGSVIPADPSGPVRSDSSG